MGAIVESEVEARALIVNGGSTDDLWLLETIDEVYMEERELAAIRGCCSVGCKPDNIVESDFGPVCHWTRLPCEKVRLGGLIELYGAFAAK